MAAESDKENLLHDLLPTIDHAKSPRSTADPKAMGKRNRSKSIGPGGLDDVLLKPSTKDRRKSAFVPAVKSILASREDEAKRKEARRKSLANRRVSFAPEATLHTWDVIEYMRDATTSSSSSSPRRNASESPKNPRKTPKNGDPSPTAEDATAQSPSTPPKQAESPIPESSPANQRDMHQRKRRRVSRVPPEISSPSDAPSSSPASATSSAASDDIESSTGSNENTLSHADGPNNGTSPDGSTTSSSGRLEEALRQAATQAGTRGIECDENEEISMDLASEEVTAAFQPWLQFKAKAQAPRPDLDQENIDPFSPAISTRTVGSKTNQPMLPESEGSDEMSMDITQAVGGILSKRNVEDTEADDATMDFTTAVGGIKFSQNAQPASQRSGIKRRRSSVFPAPASVVDASGSPSRRKSLRRTSMNHRQSLGNLAIDDETMDLTESLGGIQEMIFKANSEPAATLDMTLGDDAMDFTMAVGGIKDVKATQLDAQIEDDEGDLEDMSMELTSNFGNIDQGKLAKASTPSTAPVVKRHGSEDQILPRIDEHQPKAAAPLNLTPSPPKRSPIKPSPKRQTTGIGGTPRKSPRRSGRLSIVPMTPEQTGASYEKDVRFSPRPQKQTNEGPESQPKTPVKMEVPDAPQQQNPSPRVKESPYWLQPDTTPKANNLSQSIKSLSTPRKQVRTPVLKSTSTPKSPAQRSPVKSFTPKQTTPGKGPKKNVTISEPVPRASPVKDDTSVDEHLSLKEFLRLTNIRFLDLTTTKRRHTGAPSALTKQFLQEESADDDSHRIENAAVAGACTVPLLSLFQHSCHEMKHYISGGKDEVRMIENEAVENQPPLFKEYISAPPGERMIMDNQFKNMKSNARLQSKAGWYSWRMQLLTELTKGLKQSSLDLDEDDNALQTQEELMKSILPGLLQRNDELQKRLGRLQEHAANFNEEDQDELEAARLRLQSADEEIAQKKRLLSELQQSMHEKEQAIADLRDRKEESSEAIKAAERVREECRGWSADEVGMLKAKVDAVGLKTGWTITSANADPHTLTMTYKSELELFLHPAAFLGGMEDPMAGNQPISLGYIGDNHALRKPQPLTTSKRFFLQLLQAHLHSIPQYQTSVPDLLRTVSSGWDCADSVANAVRLLRQLCITEEAILSDERLSIKVNMVLPNLQTKVRPVIVITAHISDGHVEVFSDVTASVVYGEKYDESKMGEFLKVHMGSRLDAGSSWAESVLDLKRRLIKRGRKG
ncbi:Spc7-domain-containing protein [Eremomyces bilateralis CBS 781.70]|uniref:Spc7-domain-containing protein n=1 Tax=Eremomyces bilateralis CBS 781.70 TaxID=1392243 RepID=A0A6G1FWU1_9PEZI|nr:Spc7-domain-containing protein [Eremomyces bilateralis CBS 781.70]KAF1810355.1 Spc7-domain-containing protein [Eremomyces bilateralis CBS 781.70]